MELRQLKTFRVVAQTLSFTQTAQRLFMAQSSVSAQIKGLEEELGIKLFDRIGRKVLLTDAGRKLFEYARRMESMTEEIRSELISDEVASGSLTVRIPETLATVYLPNIVERFHKSFPQVRLNCINCSERRLKEELNSGRIDLAFLMTDMIKIKEVNVRMLKAEELILVCGPKHSLNDVGRINDRHLHGRTVLLPKTD